MAQESTLFLYPGFKGADLCNRYRYPWQGGETEAKLALQKHLNYRFDGQQALTDPAGLPPRGTNVRPYIKFGCLSVRQYYHALAAKYKMESDF